MKFDVISIFFIRIHPDLVHNVRGPGFNNFQPNMCDDIKIISK